MALRVRVRHRPTVPRAGAPAALPSAAKALRLPIGALSRPSPAAFRPLAAAPPIRRYSYHPEGPFDAASQHTTDPVMVEWMLEHDAAEEEQQQQHEQELLSTHEEAVEADAARTADFS